MTNQELRKRFEDYRTASRKRQRRLTLLFLAFLLSMFAAMTAATFVDAAGKGLAGRILGWTGIGILVLVCWSIVSAFVFDWRRRVRCPGCRRSATWMRSVLEWEDLGAFSRATLMRCRSCGELLAVVRPRAKRIGILGVPLDPPRSEPAALPRALVLRSARSRRIAFKLRRLVPRRERRRVHRVQWQVFRRVADPLSAELLVGRLAADGVPSRVEAPHLQPGVEGYYAVLVPAELLHRARWVAVEGEFSDAELTFLATGELGEEEGWQ